MLNFQLICHYHVQIIILTIAMLRKAKFGSDDKASVGQNTHIIHGLPQYCTERSRGWVIRIIAFTADY